MKTKVTPAPQASSATAPGGRLLLAAGALGIAALAAYANSFSAPFVFDDLPAIRDNPTIRALASGLFPPQASGLPVSGRPLPNFSFALNFAVSGTGVWSYHALNLAIHLLAALTLSGLVRRTLLTPRLRDRFGVAALPLAWLTALLWLLHPLATNAVTYTVERTESLMALFFLLTLYASARSAEPGAARSWPAIAVGACALGMACKEVMVSAPLLVLLYDRTFVSGTFREAWRRRAAFYSALATTWLLLGYLVLSTPGRGGTAGFATEIPVVAYAMTQLVAIVRYLTLAIWPHPLVLDYGTEIVRDLTLIVPCALVLLALVVGTLIALRRAPAVGFLGVAFFAVLAPSSSIVPIATQTIAEHRMYLPLAAVVVLVVLGGYRWFGRRSYFAFGMAAVILGLLTVRRNSDYRSNESIWRDTVSKRPQNARAACSLADALFVADRADEALLLYRRAIQLRPDYAEPHLNLGSALLARERAAEAIPELEAALHLEPTWAKAHHNLGNAFARLGRITEALSHYAVAARLRPDDVTTQCDWGSALMRTGDTAGAIAHYEEAIRREPKFAMAHNNLANVLAQTGRFTEAISRYETALQLEPNYAEGHNNLANALAQTGRPTEAIAHYETALRLRPDYARAHNNLANVLAQTGRFPEAVTHYDAALRLEPDNGEAHENLGRVLSFLGQNAAAEEHFAIARRLGRTP